MFRVADTFKLLEGNIAAIVIGKIAEGTAESKAWSMSGNFKRENREIPFVCRN